MKEKPAIWHYPASSIRDKVLLQIIKLCSRLQLWSYAKLKVPTWPSYSGAVTPICEMGDEHLLNAALRMIREGIETDIETATYNLLMCEISKRGLLEALEKRERQQSKVRLRRGPSY